MPQPPAYSRAFDFSVFAPATVPEYGARSNSEFDRVASTLATVRQNLALIQRDDGRLANAAVYLDTLHSSLRALFGGWTPRGTWATATGYAAKDVVTGPDGQTYICAAAHASGTFSADLAANRWQPLFGDAATISSATAIIATGSTAARTLGDRFAAELNVRDFGAVGDGVADDTAAFNAAAAAAASANRSIVRVPSGTYKITSQVACTSNPVRIVGDGEESIIAATGSFDTFLFGGDHSGHGIYDIAFLSTNKTGGYDYRLNGAFRFVSERVKHYNTYSAFFIGRVNACSFVDTYVSAYRGPRCVLMQGTDADKSSIVRIAMFRCAASASGVGGPALEIDGNCATVFIDGFEAVGAMMTHALHVHNAIGATDPLRFLYAYNLQSEFAGSDAIRLDAGRIMVFEGAYGSVSGGSGLYVAAGVRRVYVTGGVFGGNDQHGAYIAGDNVVLNGCEFGNNSIRSPNRATYDGVHLAGTATDISISNCVIGAVDGAGRLQRWGVYAASGATRISLVGCALFGNVLGPARDDTGGAAGNMDVVGCSGVQSTFEANTVIGAQAGFRALATATVTAGVITGAAVTDAGFHYDAAPSVTAYDPAGTGSGATFTASVANGKVTGIAVTAGGSGYSAGTLLYLTPANSDGAVRALNAAAVNANLRLRAQASGTVILGSENGTSLTVTTVADTVNGLQVVGSQTGTSPEIRALGSDADLDLRLVPKGTGLVRFGTLTASGDAPVNGYITIKTAGGGTVKLATIA